MTELYSLSQLIKAHPLYNLRRDDIHKIYYRLGQQKLLEVDAILKVLREIVPELWGVLEKNQSLFKAHQVEMQRLHGQGVRSICYGEEEFPKSCYLMADPPLTLTYLGSPSWKIGRSLSIVGSREPSSESLRWMEKELSQFCEKERPLIVSGGARGIDQKAHSIALRKNCPTAVVVPSGLGHLYPDALKDWIRPVLDQGGCFISEYDFEQRMHKHLFHHRNRLIAALGDATLLVEAKRRSGTLITAQQAVQLGRPVWIVPGHPQDPHFLGSLDLLSEGAVPIRDAQDLSMYFISELRSEQLTSIGVVESDESLH